MDFSSLCCGLDEGADVWTLWKSRWGNQTVVSHTQWIPDQKFSQLCPLMGGSC